MSSIYAVCDRVNQSQTPDSICKEAAKALRRHFKHGNEGERRAAAKIWLIMMRNIVNDVFRRMSSLIGIAKTDEQIKREARSSYLHSKPSCWLLPIKLSFPHLHIDF
jgi:hypothetical protein